MATSYASAIPDFSPRVHSPNHAPRPRQGTEMPGRTAPKRESIGLNDSRNPDDLAASHRIQRFHRCPDSGAQANNPVRWSEQDHNRDLSDGPEQSTV
jgi:hypothetical protein